MEPLEVAMAVEDPKRGSSRGKLDEWEVWSPAEVSCLERCDSIEGQSSVCGLYGLERSGSSKVWGSRVDSSEGDMLKYRLMCGSRGRWSRKWVKLGELDIRDQSARPPNHTLAGSQTPPSITGEVERM
jgi:hypothetical protein